MQLTWLATPEVCDSHLEAKKSRDVSGNGRKSPPQPQRVARVCCTQDQDKKTQTWKSAKNAFFVVETRLPPTLRAAGPRHGHGASKTFRTFHNARKGPYVDLACVESLVFWSRARLLLLPWLPASSPSLRLRPRTSIKFCLMAPWTSAWICCLQPPYHPCKNRTHNLNFHNTEVGHTPNGDLALQILDVQTAIGGCGGRTRFQPEGCAGHTPWAICGGSLEKAPRRGIISKFADTHFLLFFCAVPRFLAPGHR